MFSSALRVFYYWSFNPFSLLYTLNPLKYIWNWSHVNTLTHSHNFHVLNFSIPCERHLSHIKNSICECVLVVLLLQMLRPFLGLCGCNVQYFVPKVSPSGHVYFVCCIFVYLDFSISYIFRLYTDLHLVEIWLGRISKVFEYLPDVMYKD